MLSLFHIKSLLIVFKSSHRHENLYETYRFVSENDLFYPLTFVECAKTLESLIESKKLNPIRSNLDDLSEYFVGSFLIHDDSVNDISKSWGNSCSCRCEFFQNPLGFLYSLLPWSYPFTDLRDYFGEKITIYFHFTQHLCYFLFLLSLWSIGFQIYAWVTGDRTGYPIAFFAITVVVSTAWCIGHWKNEEATLQVMWGMSSFESEEKPRPEFLKRGYNKGKNVEVEDDKLTFQNLLTFYKGTVVKVNSPVDGDHDYVLANVHNYRIRRLISITATSACGVLVFATTFGIYVYRAWLATQSGFLAENSQYVATALNALFLNVYSALYSPLVVFLVRIEF